MSIYRFQLIDTESQIPIYDSLNQIQINKTPASFTNLNTIIDLIVQQLLESFSSTTDMTSNDQHHDQSPSHPSNPILHQIHSPIINTLYHAPKYHSILFDDNLLLTSHLPPLIDPNDDNTTNNTYPSQSISYTSHLQPKHVIISPPLSNLNDNTSLSKMNLYGQSNNINPFDDQHFSQYDKSILTSILSLFNPTGTLIHPHYQQNQNITQDDPNPPHNSDHDLIESSPITPQLSISTNLSNLHSPLLNQQDNIKIIESPLLISSIPQYIDTNYRLPNQPPYVAQKPMANQFHQPQQQSPSLLENNIPSVVIEPNQHQSIQSSPGSPINKRKNVNPHRHHRSTKNNNRHRDRSYNYSGNIPSQLHQDQPDNQFQFQSNDDSEDIEIIKLPKSFHKKMQQQQSSLYSQNDQKHMKNPNVDDNSSSNTTIPTSLETGPQPKSFSHSDSIHLDGIPIEFAHSTFKGRYALHYMIISLSIPPDSMLSSMVIPKDPSNSSNINNVHHFLSVLTTSSDYPNDISLNETLSQFQPSPSQPPISILASDQQQPTLSQSFTKIRSSLQQPHEAIILSFSQMIFNLFSSPETYSPLLSNTKLQSNQPHPSPRSAPTTNNDDIISQQLTDSTNHFSTQTNFSSTHSSMDSLPEDLISQQPPITLPHNPSNNTTNTQLPIIISQSGQKTLHLSTNKLPTCTQGIIQTLLEAELNDFIKKYHYKSPQQAIELHEFSSTANAQQSSTSTTTTKISTDLFIERPFETIKNAFSLIKPDQQQQQAQVSSQPDSSSSLSKSFSSTTSSSQSPPCYNILSTIMLQNRYNLSQLQHDLQDKHNLYTHLYHNSAILSSPLSQSTKLDVSSIKASQQQDHYNQFDDIKDDKKSSSKELTNIEVLSPSSTHKPYISNNKLQSSSSTLFSPFSKSSSRQFNTIQAHNQSNEKQSLLSQSKTTTSSTSPQTYDSNSSSQSVSDLMQHHLIAINDNATTTTAIDPNSNQLQQQQQPSWLSRQCQRLRNRINGITRTHIVLACIALICICISGVWLLTIRYCGGFGWPEC